MVHLLLQVQFFEAPLSLCQGFETLVSILDSRDECLLGDSQPSRSMDPFVEMICPDTGGTTACVCARKRARSRFSFSTLSATRWARPAASGPWLELPRALLEEIYGLIVVGFVQLPEPGLSPSSLSPCGGIRPCMEYPDLHWARIKALHWADGTALHWADGPARPGLERTVLHWADGPARPGKQERNREKSTQRKKNVRKKTHRREKKRERKNTKWREEKQRERKKKKWSGQIKLEVERKIVEVERKQAEEERIKIKDERIRSTNRKSKLERKKRQRRERKREEELWDQVICGDVDLLIKSIENSTEVHRKFDFMDRISFHVSCDHWRGSYCFQECFFLHIRHMNMMIIQGVRIRSRSFIVQFFWYYNKLEEYLTKEFPLCQEPEQFACVKGCRYDHLWWDEHFENSNIQSDRECAIVSTQSARVCDFSLQSTSFRCGRIRSSR